MPGPRGTRSRSTRLFSIQLYDLLGSRISHALGGQSPKTSGAHECRRCRLRDVSAFRRPVPPPIRGSRRSGVPVPPGRALPDYIPLPSGLIRRRSIAHNAQVDRPENEKDIGRDDPEMVWKDSEIERLHYGLSGRETNTECFSATRTHAHACMAQEWATHRLGHNGIHPIRCRTHARAAGDGTHVVWCVVSAGCMEHVMRSARAGSWFDVGGTARQQIRPELGV